MKPTDDAQPVEVDEVILPDATESGPENTGAETPDTVSHAAAAVKKAFPRALARLLDECLTIPGPRGKKIRLGLDPIIGFFFPAVGDAVTATLGTTILLEALRRRVPRPVVVRMGINIAINAGIGAIPILGDLFSIWFKSNAQNYALLERHSGKEDVPEVKPNLVPLLLFTLGIFGLIALIITCLALLFRMTFIEPLAP